MSTLLTIGLANAACAALLAVPAYLVGRYAKQPALAHALWLLVLLKLVTPPLWRPDLGWFPAESPPPPKPAPEVVKLRTLSVFDSRVSISSSISGKPVLWMVPTGESKRAAFLVNLPQPQEIVFAKTSPHTIAEASPETPSSAADLVALLWLTGSVLFLGRAIYFAAQFHRLLAACQRAPQHVQEQAGALARQMRIRRGVQVWLLPGALPPMVWGLFRVRLLFPEGLLSRLSDEERSSLLAHELAHVRRRDHWVRFLELAALTLFWWLPLAWWARRQLQAREEECCDAWAAGAVPPRVYATAILEAVDFLAEARPRLPAMACALDSHRELKQRLTLILTSPGPRRLGMLTRAGVFAAGLAVLPLLPSMDLPWKSAASPVRQHPSKIDAEYRAFTWESRSEKRLVRLDGSVRAILSNALVATAKLDRAGFTGARKAVLLWDGKSSVKMDTLTDPKETIWQARFSPIDGSVFTSAVARRGIRKPAGGDEFTLRMWRLPATK